jgi:hypothetical protein
VQSSSAYSSSAMPAVSGLAARNDTTISNALASSESLFGELPTMEATLVPSGACTIRSDLLRARRVRTHRPRLQTMQS